MATLAELQTVLNEPALRDKIRSAVVKTAVAIKNESDATPNHAERVAWAKAALQDPNGMAERVTRYVVAANAALELAAITGLSDTDIQAHTDASVAIFM